MPIDFDPVFHTETMVQILREQGSTQYAMELAELILQKNPQHEGVRRILEELREEARRAFERFKSGGRSAEAGQGPESDDAGLVGETEASAGEAGTETPQSLPNDAPSEPEGAHSRFPAPLAAVETEGPRQGTQEAAPEFSSGASPVREHDAEPAPAVVSEIALAARATPADSEPVRLTLVPPPPPPTRREAKILRLQALLRRVQSLRKADHAPQA